MISNLSKLSLRIWFLTIAIHAGVIAVCAASEEMINAALFFPMAFFGLILTAPIPFIAKFCIKFVAMLPYQFSAFFCNLYFTLVLLSMSFWIFLALFIARDFSLLEGRQAVEIIGSNFLAILVACLCSIKQMRILFNDHERRVNAVKETAKPMMS